MASTRRASAEPPAEHTPPPPSGVVIVRVSPELDAGRYPIKREVGDTLRVEAGIFREGHDKLAAALLHRPVTESTWTRTPMAFHGNDAWSAEVVLDRNTRYAYTVEAWPDPWATWVDEVGKKVAAGLDVSSELVEGIRLVEAAAHRVGRDGKAILKSLDSAAGLAIQADQVRAMISDPIDRFMRENPARQGLVTWPRELEVVVDRVTARYAAWYELFPRSAGSVARQSGTFDDVIGRLPYIRDLGFDVLYFPPIHPIGLTNRKGPNNSLDPGPGDPGCPYAIGSDAGGHDAIEPSLGTLADFDRLVEAARAHGLEIALDIAVQASPDHPWAKEHPEWFFIRPDGSIKYAENPPKKYEDIYPINFFSPDWKGLWEELRRIFLFWIDHGVTIFRVDNPHTKPVAFWEWVIAEIQRIHPETIFLSEAFTRPTVMQTLAKAGFTQSYTYFTWRNHRAELEAYFTELTTPPVSDFMRGNLFPTTPDILPVALQEGGRPAFKSRLTLAATLSSVYGMYSGYELCEATPVPGKEEFLNSEKYDYKVWDWDRPGNIRDYVSLINRARQAHPALHEYDNLRFHGSSNDAIICYGKVDAGKQDRILVVVNLDPFHVQEGTIDFDPWLFGIDEGEQYEACDLVSGQSWTWAGGHHYVRLDPQVEPAHIFHLRRSADRSFEGIQT